MYVAIEKGYLKEHNIQAELVTSPGPTAALLSGDLDVTLSDASAAFLSAAQGQSTPLVTLLGQRPTIALLVRKDKATAASDQPYPANVKALPKGARIGVSAKAGGSYLMASSVLSGAGLQENRDYTFVVLGAGANIAASLKSKRIDAAVLFPPFDTIAVEEGYGTMLVQGSAGEGPPEYRNATGAALIANKDWAEKNPEIAKNTVSALREAMTFVRDTKNEAELIEILKKYVGVDDEAAIKTFLPNFREITNPAITCERLTAHQELLVKYKIIPKVSPCDQVILSQYALSTN
jgi:NitT/TauT family transport system substrate-binding protein